MEKQKSKQKRRKERNRAKYGLGGPVPDAPTMEEFECLLGESPTNYPRGEGIENMERELHSAQIDTIVYEQETAEKTSIFTSRKSVEASAETSFTNAEAAIEVTHDVPSAPEVVEEELKEVTVNVSVIQLIEDSATAPAIEEPFEEATKLLETVKDKAKETFKEEKTIIIQEPTIKPFTEKQLSALYSNEELTLVGQFIAEFVETQLRGGIKQQHKLYELLMSYLRVRNHMILNSLDLENLKKTCKDTQKQLWSLNKACVTESGECQDGNPVSATHEYSIATFNKQALAGVTRNLTAIKDLLHNDRTLYCYEAEVIRLQIEHYVQKVCSSCIEMAGLTQTTPVSLIDVQESTQIPPQLVELRMCVTVLFAFQRRPLKDAKFVADTREWLGKLIGVHLRIANWQDHLFLLNHVLRCPGGVSKWAKSFVQLPLPTKKGLSVLPLNDHYLSHMISTLAVILLPVKEREKFLEQIQFSLQDNGTSSGDTVWVMLDEEGEEDEDIANTGATLLENDLIALLYQIPLDKLFEQVLLMEVKENGYIQSKNTVTEHHMLRIFAFFSVVVRLLKQGLETYDSPKYRQLAKRISALIRDVVQYTTDLWETFDKNKVIDQGMVLRLQVEYDCFFLRACLCIFSSRRLGAWQYLAAIPYHVVSPATLRRIFYILHTEAITADLNKSEMSAEEWEKELNSRPLRKRFEDKLCEMPGDESYYLLTTFANMAMSRNYQDYDFIRAATIDLFQIGFLSEKTQESCSKDARSLLSNLTSKYPSLLSDILVQLRDNFGSVGKLSLYLFTELRIGKWIPRDEDFAIISKWLHQHPLNSTENHLARLVLLYLNWGFNENDNLFISVKVHQKIAILVVELVMKYLPDLSTQNASLLAEGMKQVSSMVRPQNNEQAFAIWAWEMISKLHLHYLDHSDAACRFAMANPGKMFSSVPDMDSHEALEILIKGVKEKQPIACYVATIMTLWGHSVPLICSKGFAQLHLLLNYYKYEQVMIALHHIIPLFIDCTDSIVKNEKFTSIMSTLISADRSYVKMAKNLIISDFPGPILRMMGNLIESHLQNYRRYCLPSPEPFVRLWINILVNVPDWNRDQSVMHLLDVVLRSASFYPDSRMTAEVIFQELFSLTLSGSSENLLVGRNTGSFGSFLSWATGSANSPSLLGGSVQTVWVSYQVLSTEQRERELKSGLWKELLKELANPKISLDSALKKACATVKIPSFGANGLGIYRWSQQALDAPLDHPILPLLWQNFFMLFLSRIPSSPGANKGQDRGGAGDRFFEGMINLSYLKKIKKRLSETTDFFQQKGENDTDNGKSITDERRIFYFNYAKFYKTLSLWLEEPRLQEPGLYLSALPPQYMPQKLLQLMQGDQEPWLEYVDYQAVQQSQQQALSEWRKLCSRDHDDLQVKSTHTPTTPLEPADPVQRIVRRLTTYEKPDAPPPLPSTNLSVIKPIKRESMYNPDFVVCEVRPQLKIILDYAQSYNLLVSEHTAVDCSFLELAPTLYREATNRITLHALCDPSPSSKKQPRSGTPPAVFCAGPAVIDINIQEAQVNETVNQMITQNRAEYENLLTRATQPPPVKVTQACGFCDYLITVLEHELNVSKTSENNLLLRKVKESGVKLFHHLVEFYTEEAALCPSTKQLLTTCIERLGQLFISGEESEGPRLLNAIIKKPHMGGILGPHFTPVAGGATTFLQMYQTLVELSSGSNPDLCFVLLSKFDVESWLNYRRPRLSERSTFIDLISKALCNIGLNPDDDKLILHEQFRGHLRLILLHEFPEHYGEVLSAILKGSEEQNLSLDVWRDLLTALSGKPKSSTIPIHQSKIRDEIRHYATEQRMLSIQEMHDTAVLLSRHFMKERLQYGLYGLYPKYRVYIEPLSMFLGMIGHALVVLTLQTDRGTLADQLCERIWPVISEMFAPWITPYWTRNLREPTAAWIQQLTDDRSVLLPWIITDGPYANKVVAMYVECIRFVLDTLPASSKSLSFLWHFYVTNFAHASVKDHILNVIHGNFLTLNWEKFHPCVNDLELMIKVIDQYLPDCHLFLGSIFTSVNWTAWTNELVLNQPLLIAARMHVCILNLIVKLANEPNVRQNDKAIQMVRESEKFAWHLVDAASYDQVVNWHVMSCDPRVVLAVAEQEHPVDSVVHNLLKIVAGYDSLSTHFHPTTLKKRQMFIRSNVKLLINCTTRYKALLSTNGSAFNNALTKMLEEMEIVITNTVVESQQVPEAGLLLTELLHSANQSSILLEQVRVTWTIWLSSRTASSPILTGMLRVIGVAVASSAVLGDLMEAALDAYFKQNVTDTTRPTWCNVLTIIQPIVPRQPPVEGILVSEGKLLALYAVLLKRLPSCDDIREEGMILTNLVDWISAIKPTEMNEEKLPLLWAKALELALRQCQYSENTVIAARALKSLAKALMTVADDAGQGWGILGAIGLRKGSQLSTKCKFLSRALGVYCLAQLPESKADHQLVRFTPHAAGVAPTRANNEQHQPDSLEVRPSADAVKSMQTLESLLTNKQYAELRGDIEQAIRLIRDSANSLHNAVEVVGTLTAELYHQRYLHVLIDIL